MSPRILVPLALIATVTAFAAIPASPPVTPAAAALTTRTVYVTLKCETQSGWVSDSSLHAAPGDTIDFVLTEESDVIRFKVKRKKWYQFRWPFQRSELDGEPGKPAHGDDMKPNAKGRYPYMVEGTCRGGPKAIIDPDIIIDLDS